jgi:hypothetical protein
VSAILLLVCATSKRTVLLTGLIFNTYRQRSEVASCISERHFLRISLNEELAPASNEAFRAMPHLVLAWHMVVRMKLSDLTSCLSGDVRKQDKESSEQFHGAKPIRITDYHLRNKTIKKNCLLGCYAVWLL